MCPYTTLWNINIRKTAKAWHMYYDNNTSQHSVATWFRCGGMLDDDSSITNLLLNLLRKNFWDQSTFGKVMAQVSCHTRALSCWKMKNSLEIWHMVDRNCCTSITLRLILLTTLDSVIKKCRTNVMPTTCDSTTDAISDWRLIVRAGVLSRHLSSWFTDVRRVGHYGHPIGQVIIFCSCGFFLSSSFFLVVCFSVWRL